MRKRLCKDEQQRMDINNTRLTTMVNYLLKITFHFIPFIVENHGFIHPQSLKLLEVLAAKAELTWRLPSKVIFEYWLKVLSVTVHRAMANSIVSRARTLTSGIATSKRSAWNEAYYS